MWFLFTEQAFYLWHEINVEIIKCWKRACKQKEIVSFYGTKTGMGLMHFFSRKLVDLCKAEVTTRQRAISGLHFLPLIHLLFADSLTAASSISDLISLVRPGRGFQLTTLGGEHSTTRPPICNLVSYIRPRIIRKLLEPNTLFELYDFLRITEDLS